MAGEIIVAGLANDATDDPVIPERIESFAGGEDNYHRSTMLNPDQSQKLTNVVIRDNMEACTRPGCDPWSAQIAAFPIASLAYFDTPANKFAMAVCNGKLYACSASGLAWTDTTWSTALTTARVELEQGVDTLLISDGTNAMATLDQSLTLTTCGTASTDPPTGANILCWHSGRMFASGFAGGVSGKERDAIIASNRLAFGTGNWNATTGSFRVGAGDGDPITALRSMQGAILAVFKANSVWIVDADPTKDPANYNISQLGFGVGCVGKWAAAAFGNDVFFMAQDGVRSVQRMQAAAAQWQLTAPISQPVQKYIDRITPAYRQNICAAAYKELVLFAVPLDGSTVNNAVLVYNTRLMCWLGCWTGWKVTRFAKTKFNNVEQLLFGDNSGYVQYWKDAADIKNQTTYTDNGANIATTLFTRAMVFGAPNNTKTAYNVLMAFSAANTSATVTAVIDLAENRRMSANFSASGDRLGQGVLPFTLASSKPAKVQKSLRGLPTFNEFYLKIETSSGFIMLRSVTVSAFVNPLSY